MDRNRAERRFCWKISAELKSFKFRMMQMSKQEIYDHAYEIDCMIRIYEELVNISERLETEQLQIVWRFPAFYRWSMKSGWTLLAHKNMNWNRQ